MLGTQSPYLCKPFKAQNSTESILGLHNRLQTWGSLLSPPSKDRNELASNYKKAEKPDSENKFAKEGYECLGNVRAKSGNTFFWC
jgi:hypothetical protein